MAVEIMKLAAICLPALLVEPFSWCVVTGVAIGGGGGGTGARAPLNFGQWGQGSLKFWGYSVEDS